jgi:hypothetical protein
VDSPLKVDVETIPAPVGFEEALASLRGRRFGRRSLRPVRYRQLHLCCLATAGSAACPVPLVRAEKARRLGRFLSLDPDALAESSRWLMAEGMWGDLLAELDARSSPEWGRLRPGQRAVALLLCLYNHLDDPEERLLGAVEALRESAADGVPPMLCSELCSRLTDLGRRALSPETPEKERVGPNELREGLWRSMEALLSALPREEQRILLREKLRNYSCTSDCFRCHF